MSNLLVLDFDYFFPNPFDGGSLARKDRMLFDWSHNESILLIDIIWSTRASGFLINNLELPRTNDEWKTMASRFRFTDDVYTLYAESNFEAGKLCDHYGNPFESVWLYDAHHDSGYRYKTMQEFHDAETFSCEDWMLVHYTFGSELHVRYPKWKIGWRHESPPPEDLVIDRQVDDGSDPGVVFDTVFVCRSGAWVPSWEDDKFFEFLKTLPGDKEETGDYPCTKRDFDEEQVREQAQEYKKFLTVSDDIKSPTEGETHA